MGEHRITIGALQSTCTLLGAPAEVAPLERRLSRALAEGLPRRLAALADPLLEGRDGVIRLRRLRLRLSLGAELDEASLAAAFAREIASALRGAVQEAGPEHRAWASPEAYLAAYLLHRLGIAPEPDWAFPDFAALRYLSGSEAAAELLAGRPERLPALLAALPGADRTKGDSLARRLDEPEAARLLRSWDGAVQADWPPELLGQFLHLTGPGLWAALAGPRPGQASLGLIFALMDQAPPKQTVPRLRAGLDLLALVRSLQVAPALRDLAPEDGVARLAEGRIKTLSPWAEAAPALMALAQTPGGRALLTQAIPRLRTALAGADPGAAGARDVGAAAQGLTQGTEVASPWAGLALLLPSVIRHGAGLAPGQVRDLILSLAPEPDLARSDPGLAALLPPPEREALPWPACPEADRLDPEARGLCDGGWAGFLLGDFASRLPGLRGSSRPYLEAQFLAQPGRVRLSAETLMVMLEGPPLGIVLRMAGYDGPQGVLGHHGGRQLILDLGGGR